MKKDKCFLFKIFAKKDKHLSHVVIIQLHHKSNFLTVEYLDKNINFNWFGSKNIIYLFIS